jgi:glutamyl-tRNA synthetase
MDWGNAIVRSRERNADGKVTSLTMDLNLEGDFRKTKKKITWLAQPTADHPLASVALVDFDYLITKKKLEENDDVKDFVTPTTEFKEFAYADANVLELRKGDIIQFERKGYYIYDDEKDGVREFFKIPDGKAAGIASKAGALPTPAAGKSGSPDEKTVAKPEQIPPVTSMYKVERVCEEDFNADLKTKMYKMEDIYKS